MASHWTPRERTMTSRAPWWQAYFDADYQREFDGAPEYVGRAALEAAFVATLVREAGLGRRVLDLACGFGRHSIEMLRLGLEVVSLDRSAAQLAELARRAEANGVDANIVEADMRDFRLAQPVDAAVLLFSSFGYFAEDENAAVLERCRRALVPGGLILLDLDNPATIPEGPYQFWRRLARGGFVLNEAEMERGPRRRLRGQRVHIDAAGQSRTYDYDFALYDEVEIRTLLQQAGFENVQCFGNFDGSPLTDDAPRLLALAR